MRTAYTSKSSNEIVAENISTARYDSWSCKSLKNEIVSLEGRVMELAKTTDARKKTQDEKELAGWLFFWPALFFIDDNSAEAKEYARIKGERNAVNSSYQRKDCGNKI